MIVKIKILLSSLLGVVLLSAILIPTFILSQKKTPEDTNDNNPDDVISDNSTMIELFYSESVDDIFKLYISLPIDYNQTITRYPVIFLLDADWLFYGTNLFGGIGGVKRIIERLQQDLCMPEVIFIGIGYPDTNYRNRDFIYPSSIFPPGSGGAHEFYSFLSSELIPYVDLNFRTNESYGRTIIGDSYGGNFLLFSIFQYSTNTSSLFTNYISISPSVSYFDYYLLTLEEIYFNSSFGILPINLYLSVGENEWQDMVEGVSLLNQTLSNRNYINFTYFHQLYSDKDHLSVIEPAITDGLKWVFSL